MTSLSAPSKQCQIRVPTLEFDLRNRVNATRDCWVHKAHRHRPVSVNLVKMDRSERCMDPVKMAVHRPVPDISVESIGKTHRLGSNTGPVEKMHRPCSNAGLQSAKDSTTANNSTYQTF
ncbi:hypothetical protein M0802_004430 [Mischocyttarus mexicanus]|nr:hypothetical protein M0802_004430 [Mischocyttarus mexicanus]